MSIDVEQIVRENIDRIIHLSLATSIGDQPWVCEVHFAFDDDLNLYFRSLTSRRHSQEIEQNPKVSGNIIDKFGLEDPPIGLYFEGTAKRLPAGPEQEIAAQCLIERLNITKDIVAEAQDESGHQFYKISVDTWYAFGDFDGNGPQKYSLQA